MLHDLKHAYRMLMHSKGWTVVVLLSLAIGIGATTALFTAVNGLLLLRPPGLPLVVATSVNRVATNL